LPEKTEKKSRKLIFIKYLEGGGLFWSFLLKKVKKNIYIYTKTYEIGGSLNREYMK
jgi:hypothetical protein